MGLVNSTSTNSYDNKKVKLTKKQKKYRRQQQRIVNLLLYGPGECGKTTILRQMMLAHGNSLERERQKFRPNICFNVIEGAHIVLKMARLKFNVDFGAPGTKFTMNKVAYEITEKDALHAATVESIFKVAVNDSLGCNLNPNPDFDPSEPLETQAIHGPYLVDAVKYLFNESEAFKALIKARGQYSLYENWMYFADSLKNYPEWGGKDWQPSDQDLLMSRLRTTGLNTFVFKLNNTKYKLIDVGGQREERRKFLFLFTQMDCVVFVASLADYDENLFEDATTNRLEETLRVWETDVNSDDFKDTWVLLLLNKFDLFQEKYYDRKIPIRAKRIKPHKAPPKMIQEENRDCKKAIDWFTDEFKSRVSSEKLKQVRMPYVTSALEESNIMDTMNRCVTFLLHKLVEAGG